MTTFFGEPVLQPKCRKERAMQIVMSIQTRVRIRQKPCEGFRSGENSLQLPEAGSEKQAINTPCAQLLLFLPSSIYTEKEDRAH